MGDVAYCVGICSPLGAKRPTKRARLPIDVQLPARDMTYLVMGYDRGRLALGAFLSTLVIVESILRVL